MVPQQPVTEESDDSQKVLVKGRKNKKKSRKRMSWAQLLKRVFKIDMEICSKCKGKLKIIDVLFPGEKLTVTLQALGLPILEPQPEPPKLSHRIFDY